MPWIVAGSAGVVDVTWYGSTMTSPDNTPANSGEYWNVFFAQVTNALSATPTIAQTIVAGAVHNLPICSQGGNCSGNTRDLAEYYTMTIDPDGNANIAYVDELNYCAAFPASNCFAHTYYTKQTGGPSAYTPPAAPASATFAANLVMPSSSGDAEPNMKADSHNCLFSAAPGPPDAWKSTDAGASFLAPPNPVTSLAESLAAVTRISSHSRRLPERDLTSFTSPISPSTPSTSASQLMEARLGSRPERRAPQAKFPFQPIASGWPATAAARTRRYIFGNMSS